jgi:hypothetical protein
VSPHTLIRDIWGPIHRCCRSWPSRVWSRGCWRFTANEPWTWSTGGGRTCETRRKNWRQQPVSRLAIVQMLTLLFICILNGFLTAQKCLMICRDPGKVWFSLWFVCQTSETKSNAGFVKIPVWSWVKSLWFDTRVVNPRMQDPGIPANFLYLTADNPGIYEINVFSLPCS